MKGGDARVNLDGQTSQGNWGKDQRAGGTNFTIGSWPGQAPLGIRVTGIGTPNLPPVSWPALCRPPGNCGVAPRKVPGGRAEPGHDTMGGSPGANADQSTVSLSFPDRIANIGSATTFRYLSGMRTIIDEIPCTKLEKTRFGSSTSSITGKRFMISSHKIVSCSSASLLPTQR
jgi:hypothetical protein